MPKHLVIAVGANKLCHGDLREYGFIVDSHFLTNKFRLNIKMRCLPQFSKIHDGIFMLDKQLRFICVNQQF